MKEERLKKNLNDVRYVLLHGSIDAETRKTMLEARRKYEKELKELKYFYELRNQEGGLIHQSELFDTPEEARENGIDDANGRDFICKGVVYECDSTGGTPIGDESDEDEWTFYGGNEED